LITHDQSFLFAGFLATEESDDYGIPLFSNKAWFLEIWARILPQVSVNIFCLTE